MTPNTNEQTGIPYGVISGNNVPELFDDICTFGDDLTFENWKLEIRDRILGAVRDVVDDYCHSPEQIVDESTADDIVETLLDSGLNDSYECDESRYSYKYNSPHGKVRIVTSYLGGAPLIYVIESPYVAECRMCSPCVPNAGDLDNLTADGSYTYCLPPEDMPAECDRSLIFRRVQTGEIIPADSPRHPNEVY